MSMFILGFLAGAVASILAVAFMKKKLAQPLKSNNFNDFESFHATNLPSSDSSEHEILNSRHRNHKKRNIDDEKLA